MKNALLAALLAATIVVPANSQTIGATGTTAAATTVAVAEPIPVANDAPAGSSITPMGASMGGVAAIVVIGFGLIIACGIACAN